MDQTASTLSRISLFADLPLETLVDIESRCTWRRVGEGEQVFDKDSDSLDVYFVADGVVRILNVTEDGRDIALADIPAGRYFGELAAIDGMRRSARVIAIKDSLLALLDAASFLDLMRRYPDIALRVLERLTRIVRDLDSRVTRLSIESEHQRVWSELLRLAQPDPAPPEGWSIPDLPNHKEIAAWAGTSREQVAQAIGELARDGIVKRKGIGLVICDHARLRRMAAGGDTASRTP